MVGGFGGVLLEEGVGVEGWVGGVEEGGYFDDGMLIV